MVCILLWTVVICAVPSASAKEYLSPAYEYTTNFYKAYGEPDLSVTLLGDTEFNRGETADLKVVLSNRGVLYGFKADKGVGSSVTMHELSLRELQYETLRTTAYGVKASLVSTSDLIEVDPEKSSHTIEKISPGVLPDDPLLFTITLSHNIPAGVYVLELPLSYEYSKDVRMTQGETVILGRPDLDHVVYYENVETKLQIPIIVKPEAKFTVSDVQGTLTGGGKDIVNITYTNIGELPAEDALARIVIMKPLSTDRSIKSLGTMQPGESKMVSFLIGSELGAVEKTYSIDSEIRYSNEKGEYVFSENMKVNVDLISPERKFNVTGLALAGIVVILMVLVVKNRRKND
ncbi:COG1361 S-layer family protein [Methanolobus sp. WCC5]|uniref:COG1361 S-layer family protein n=1 Tax=Methanolobus sp. WCC5 TaxID=3125785 RepID=UPI00324F52BC